MLRRILFCLLALALAACAAPPVIPTPTAAPTSTPGPSIEQSRSVLEAFFAAYNNHDVDAVLATLSAGFAYGDCDFASRRMLVFEERQPLAEWLMARFGEADQMVVEEMIIAPAEGSPPNDPRSTAVRVRRTHAGLPPEAPTKRSLFKIVLNEAGTHIQFLNTYGNVDCEEGR